VRVDSGASDTYDYFYNEAWKLLEERKDGDADPLNQYVWNADYIDSLALRYYDSDTDASRFPAGSQPLAGGRAQ
jgi:hypothetical protein